MNVQRRLIQKLMLYEFELDHITVEATQNICCAKGKGAFDYHTVDRWFKEFRSGCNKLNDQA